jgi:hypothetical protein
MLKLFFFGFADIFKDICHSTLPRQSGIQFHAVKDSAETDSALSKTRNVPKIFRKIPRCPRQREIQFSIVQDNTESINALSETAWNPILVVLDSKVFICPRQCRMHTKNSYEFRAVQKTWNKIRQRG